MNASQLYQKHTMKELLVIREELEKDPNNTNKDGLYLYNPPTRKKLAAIDQAIAFHLADKREVMGNPVPVNGFSGRKSN